MATIIEFPDSQEREWREWEEAIRQKLKAEGVDDLIAEHALPRIRSHWTAVFEPIEFDLPKRPVSGKLTRDQAATIQSLIDASARLVVERLQFERRISFERLVQVEVALSSEVLRANP